MKRCLTHFLPLPPHKSEVLLIFPTTWTAPCPSLLPKKKKFNFVSQFLSLYVIQKL